MDFAPCSLNVVTQLTKMIYLLKQSGIEIEPARLTWQHYLNTLDIQPKVPIVFQPGMGYEPPAEPTDQQEAQKKKDLMLTFVSQIAKKKFLVRRGRNDRVLSRSILANVFQDNFGFEDDADMKPKNS